MCYTAASTQVLAGSLPSNFNTTCLLMITSSKKSDLYQILIIPPPHINILHALGSQLRSSLLLLLLLLLVCRSCCLCCPLGCKGCQVHEQLSHSR